MLTFVKTKETIAVTKSREHLLITDRAEKRAPLNI